MPAKFVGMTSAAGCTVHSRVAAYSAAVDSYYFYGQPAKYTKSEDILGEYIHEKNATKSGENYQDNPGGKTV